MSRYARGSDEQCWRMGRTIHDAQTRFGTHRCPCRHRSARWNSALGTGQITLDRIDDDASPRARATVLLVERTHPVRGDKRRHAVLRTFGWDAPTVDPQELRLSDMA